MTDSSRLMITDSHRQLLLDLLKQYLPNTEVWVFGSRTQGRAHSYSDLDMVVWTNVSQAGAVNDFRDACDESQLPFRVDVLIWHELPLSFQENILRDHQVLVPIDKLSVGAA